MSSDDLVREAHDPATTPARLAELAQADRSTWPAIALNPAAYDGLLQWLGERGDAAVDAALAQRAALAAAPEPTVVLPSTADHEPTVVLGSASGAEPGPEPTPDSASGRPLGVVIAMAVVIVALIGGAAFGATRLFADDDSDTPLAGGPTPSAVPDPSDDPPTPAPSDDTDSSDGGGSGDAEDFCDAMVDIQDVTLGGLGTDGSGPDLGDLEGMADDMVDAYEDLEDAAPDDLKADVALIGSYLELLTDPTAEGVQDLTGSMDSYLAASQRLGLYYAQNCS